MNRRDALAVLIGGACSAAVAKSCAGQGGRERPDMQAALANTWALWKARHLDPSGRVVDGGQANASHSEGQGYGLAIAAMMGDVQTAQSIVGWTQANLAVRDDDLLAWRWRPDASPNITDRNNAADGDLCFAWGLLRAGTAFGRPDYVERSRIIGQALGARCVADDPRGNGRLVFLPAVDGFRQEQSVVVNPSYAMPRFMEDLGMASGVASLTKAANDTLGLLTELAAVGTTPDWIAITPKGLVPAATQSDRTGYEAMRMPLFLIWSDRSSHPMVARHRAVIANAHAAPSDTATVFDRLTGAVEERSDHVGYAACAALLGCLGPDRNAFPPMPPFGAPQPYYPATLHVMALIAAMERVPTCLPL